MHNYINALLFMLHIIIISPQQIIIMALSEVDTKINKVSNSVFCVCGWDDTLTYIEQAQVLILPDIHMN